MSHDDTRAAGNAGDGVSAVPPFLALALVLAVVLLPIWSVSIPPLLDYPNHLARQYILDRLPDSAILQQFYVAEWHLVPNLAMDAIVQVLSRVLPVDIAGKIFLSTTLLLVGLAPLVLSRALFGYITPISLAGLLFVNSEVVGLGFVNFVFSAGLALCLLAGWIRFGNRGHRVALTVFPLLSLALFFAHLAGYGVYVALAFSYEFGVLLKEMLGRRPEGLRLLWRDKWPSYLSLMFQVAVPMAIFLLVSPTSTVPEPSVYGGIGRKLNLLRDIFFYLIQPHSWTLDHGMALVLTVTLVAIILLRVVVVSGLMLWPLICMTLLVLAMPMSLFGAWGADHRLLLPLGLLLAGSLRIAKGAALPWNAARAIVILAVVARVGVVTVEWHRANRTYEEYLRAFKPLNDGDKLYFACGQEGGKRLWPAPVYNLPCLAVATKDLYIPYLFANPSQQPLQYTTRYADLQHSSPGPVLLHGNSPNWKSLMRSFDYFLLTNDRYFQDPIPKDLVLVFRGEHVALYRNPGSERLH